DAVTRLARGPALGGVAEPQPRGAVVVPGVAGLAGLRRADRRVGAKPGAGHGDRGGRRRAGDADAGDVRRRGAGHLEGADAVRAANSGRPVVPLGRLAEVAGGAGAGGALEDVVYGGGRRPVRGWGRGRGAGRGAGPARAGG